jgi:hypothetical protein
MGWAMRRAARDDNGRPKTATAAPIPLMPPHHVHLADNVPSHLRRRAADYDGESARHKRRAKAAVARKARRPEARA